MKYYFLLTIIFCTNYLFANHPLLEKANDGPRWIKTTTVIDCRKTRKNAQIPDGKIGLGVHVIDIDGQTSIYYTGHHSERKNWNMFQYKIYEENHLLLGVINYKYRIQDVYEDAEEILFVEDGTEYIFNKKTMMIRAGNNTPRKCRYL
tara:strand:+ start:112 stop:555 length:444 start_codon:yes stop_codon:yes gene_type:complete